MIISIKKILTTNIVLKIISCILGCVTWYIVAGSCTHTLQVTVPLTFYNIPEQWTISAPETIIITLLGKRNIIRSIDTAILAAHINGSILHEGTQSAILTSQQLFLPSSIKLIDWNPMPLLITITQKT